MKKEALRIVFMGTPEFAVTILDKIVSDGYQVVGCVTVLDKPAGRGQKIHESAVKQYAVKNNLNVLQPEKLKSEDFIQKLVNLHADIFVVVAFRMLPKVVWSMPKMGTFNLHGSLLPDYRGAAPINWAVINGETETGVTTFFLNEEIDTGEIILQDRMTIGPNETAGEIHDRMMHLGANAVAQTLELLSSGTFTTRPQKTSESIKSAPKLFRENSRIDFTKEGIAVHNFIRGLSPYPAAWTEIIHKESGNVKTLKIFNTTCEKQDLQFTSHFQREGKRLFLSLKGSRIEIHELQVEGKRRMSTKDFLLGFAIEEWKIQNTSKN
jgi:methionyl-tRNA formyltransferase